MPGFSVPLEYGVQDAEQLGCRLYGGALLVGRSWDGNGDVELLLTFWEARAGTVNLIAVTFAVLGLSAADGPHEKSERYILDSQGVGVKREDVADKNVRGVIFALELRLYFLGVARANKR